MSCLTTCAKCGGCFSINKIIGGHCDACSQAMAKRLRRIARASSLPRYRINADGRVSGPFQ